MRKTRNTKMPDDPAGLHTLSQDTRPELSAKARIRIDKLSGIPILLYPEGLLLLNTTGVAIIRLCDGQHTLTEIMRELAMCYQVAPETLIEDVGAYIMRLHYKALVEFYG
jgi:pyrroloquinoline quinone biosynthesis protein D